MVEPRSTSGHFVVHDLARQAFGDGGLADAGIAHKKRIVFLTAAENLDGALDFGGAADQGIHPARLGLLVQIDAIGFERVSALLVGFLVGLVIVGARAPAWAGSCPAAWRCHG